MESFAQPGTSTCRGCRVAQSFPFPGFTVYEYEVIAASKTRIEWLVYLVACCCNDDFHFSLLSLKYKALSTGLHTDFISHKSQNEPAIAVFRSNPTT